MGCSQSNEVPVVLAPWKPGSLAHAVRWGSVAQVRMMLDKGADVNDVDENGMTALHQAAYWGKTDIVSLLLERGAAADAENREGSTSAHLAERMGYAETAAVLHESASCVTAVLCDSARLSPGSVKLKMKSRMRPIPEADHGRRAAAGAGTCGRGSEELHHDILLGVLATPVDLKPETYIALPGSANAATDAAAQPPPPEKRDKADGKRALHASGRLASGVPHAVLPVAPLSSEEPGAHTTVTVTHDHKVRFDEGEAGGDRPPPPPPREFSAWVPGRAAASGVRSTTGHVPRQTASKSPYAPRAGWQGRLGTSEWCFRYTKPKLITLCVLAEGNLLIITAIEGDVHDPASQMRQLHLTLSDYVAAGTDGWDWASALANSDVLVSHLNKHICHPIAESSEREWRRSIEASSPRCLQPKERKEQRRRLGCPASPRSGSVSSPSSGLSSSLLQLPPPAQAAPRARSQSKPSPRGVPFAATAAAVRIPQTGWRKPRDERALFTEDDGYAGELESTMGSSPPDVSVLDATARGCGGGRRWGGGAECSSGAAELPSLLSRPLYLAATTSGAVAAVVAVAAAFAIARA
ncbi:hypothetical protein FOA52_005250 [Chlamydomonas sp. UWO 241]|nr:hypothetical protein FOA52_005250 [Chlamydomonas sp. UWO 241]